MTKYYFAIKWSRADQLDTCRLTLYSYNPIHKACSLESYSPLTAGQLLCHIGCSELEQWKYVDQMTICDFVVSCYCYPAIEGGCDTKLIVIEYCPLAICQAVGKPEPYTPKIETGGVFMKEHQFSYNLTPSEFQAIYNLLIDTTANIEATMLGNSLRDGDGQSQTHQYDAIQNLTDKMRNSMDDWLLHYPMHTYTKWRMDQLRNYREEIMKLYGLIDNEEENQ